jgi:hypothetical protein
MILEDAKLHFFKLYRWISERVFNKDLYCFNKYSKFFFNEQSVYIPNSGDGAKLVSLN